MKRDIVVIGGYGQVGQVVCRELGALYPGKVYAAGRSYSKAKRFSDATGGNVLPLQLDVNERLPAAVFREAALVVMCLDVRHTGVVQACVDHGVDYIDITADYSAMASIEKLRAAESTVVLSVGLAPGITNMLVKRGKQKLDTVLQADIYVLLGLGEAHGRAAIEWTLDNLAADFSVVEQGAARQTASFSEGKKTRFPVRKANGIPFQLLRSARDPPYLAYSCGFNPPMLRFRSGHACGSRPKTSGNRPPAGQTLHPREGARSVGGGALGDGTVRGKGGRLRPAERPAGAI